MNTHFPAIARLGRAAGLGLALLAGSALAQTTPAGLWRQIDENTRKDTSLVRITDAGGVLSAKVEKVLAPPFDDAVCEACTGELKNAPIRGLTIIKSLHQRPDEKNVYDGGEILDPHNGKLYRVRLTLSADGKTLDVRGYIGTPLLGRTQTWIRAE